MKTLSFISLATAIALLSGCGGSSTTDTAGITTTTNPATSITVERGPILKAIVVDANGQKAVEDGNGHYTFVTKPTYPVLATGGFIDVDRDGNVTVGDVVNDINLTTTSGDVLTIATTLATNPKTKTTMEQIAQDLNMSIADLYTKTPSESKEIEAISNAIYKYAQEHQIDNLLDLNATDLTDANLTTEIHTTYSVYINDDAHDPQQEEEDLIQTIYGTTTSVLNIIDNEAELEDELSQIEAEHENIDIDSLTQELEKLKNEYEIEYGDIDYEDDGGATSSHYQGRSCFECHGSVTTLSREVEDDENENDENEGSENEGSEGEDGENQFTSGATIFTMLHANTDDATKAANNYTLRLVLENGAGIARYNIGRGTGNVNGTFNAGINRYTAEVLNAQGEVVNSSATNSHDASRFDCNSCHNTNGTNGAPGRIVSFQYTIQPVTDTNTTVPTDTNTTVPTDTNTTVPTDTNTTVPTDTNTTVPTVTRSFANDVAPILQTKCAMCHGSSGNFTITNSTTTYAGVVPWVNTADAVSSALLRKATNQSGHGGGAVISSSSPEYITIRDWISEGALNN